MIELSGLKPDVDIQIEFVGLRPGEKLFEEVSHRLENMVPTQHPKILRLPACRGSGPDSPDPAKTEREPSSGPAGPAQALVARRRPGLCAFFDAPAASQLRSPRSKRTASSRNQGPLLSWLMLRGVKNEPRHLGGCPIPEMKRHLSAYDSLAERLLIQPRVWLITGAAGFIGSNLLSGCCA